MVWRTPVVFLGVLSIFICVVSLECGREHVPMGMGTFSLERFSNFWRRLGTCSIHKYGFLKMQRCKWFLFRASILSVCAAWYGIWDSHATLWGLKRISCVHYPPGSIGGVGVSSACWWMLWVYCLWPYLMQLIIWGSAWPMGAFPFKQLVHGSPLLGWWS